MSDAPTIIITGATGFIGSHLVTHFATRGWKIIALVRTAPEKTLPAVSYVQYDLKNSLENHIFSGADFLVHCAYIKDEVHFNIEGAKRLLAASRSYALKRNIFISSISSHENALSNYGKQKFLCEKLFGSITDTVVRPGLVLGNGGLFQRMSEYIKKGRRIPLISGGYQPIQTVWINDLLLALEKILVSNIHGTFTIAHPEVVLYKEFYKSLSRKLGVEPRFLSLPYFAVSSALYLASSLGIRLPVTKENLLGLKAMKQVDTKTDIEKLGISVRSFSETLQQL